MLKITVIIGLVLLIWAHPSFGKSVEDYYKAGVRYLDKGKYAKAIRQFQKILQERQDLPQIYNLMGVAYLREGKSIESAVGSFQEAVRLDPHFTEGYYNLGVTYVGPGDNPSLAAQYFEKAIETNPDFFPAYLGLGWITLSINKDPEKAILLFEKAIQCPEKKAEAYYGLGMAYATLGKKEMTLMPISMLRSMNRLDLSSIEESMIKEKPGQGDGS
ncbi:MAG: tetratricopeptide repeat protein [Candidatus Omnitrophica bacterium]|nr:tetratricopeptide repeat protein [Candidatus Omnitrophota bacterium]